MLIILFPEILGFLYPESHPKYQWAPGQGPLSLCFSYPESRTGKTRRFVFPLGEGDPSLPMMPDSSAVRDSTLFFSSSFLQKQGPRADTLNLMYRANVCPYEVCTLKKDTTGDSQQQLKQAWIRVSKLKALAWGCYHSEVVSFPNLFTPEDFVLKFPQVPYNPAASLFPCIPLPLGRQDLCLLVSHLALKFSLKKQQQQNLI